MKRTIQYSTNVQLWSLEKNLRALGYRKTSDCYWAQIFENDTGCMVILERE